MTPAGGANFDPRAKIWTIFKEVHQTMFHVKSLSSSLYGLGGEFFFNFSLYVYKETNDPRGGVNFDHRAIIWTTFVEVH